MDIKGKVHFVSDVINVTETFRKRELVVEYAENPQYPEFVKFEATQDRVALLDGLSVGQDVEIFFNLRGREWTNKQGEKQYFNTLQLWKVNVLGAAEPSSAAAAPSIPTVDISSDAGADDDLPF
ncbi:hypothetical protein BCY91_00830 [Pelobium manganitolerans]|uniref:DUF3127 domain-containing protein n=1 Tax=Pelobium manganitolerans TaxID=1842495 RepID=A0A419SBJ9_9SPHI|nr:DUF3127 domain-containing protein [Pelobium manganitolerans]RKD20202.1 hypothetical protein BCY91_00830 [Pelobium manganitolerans]